MNNVERYPDGALKAVFNPDGSVYARFQPAAEVWSDREGWVVRHVSTCHETPLGRGFGSTGLVRSDAESFRSLMRMIAEISRAYGYRAKAVHIGILGDHFRWSWERRTAEGYHVSDMIIASKINAI